MAKEKKEGGAFSLVLAWAGANRKFLVASMVAATVSGGRVHRAVCVLRRL